MRTTQGFTLLLIALASLSACSPPVPTTEDQTSEQAAPVDIDHREFAAASTAAPLDLPAGAIQVSIAELEAAYDRNEAAAQLQYGKKTLYVTGEIGNITLDMDDDPVVSFASKSFLSSDLRFDAKHEAQAGTLAKGEVRTFICEAISEVMGSPSLKKCRLPD